MDSKGLSKHICLGARDSSECPPFYKKARGRAHHSSHVTLMALTDTSEEGAGS